MTIEEWVVFAAIVVALAGFLWGYAPRKKKPDEKFLRLFE